MYVATGVCSEVLGTRCQTSVVYGLICDVICDVLWTTLNASKYISLCSMTGLQPDWLLEHRMSGS